MCWSLWYIWWWSISCCTLRIKSAHFVIFSLNFIFATNAYNQIHGEHQKDCIFQLHNQTMFGALFKHIESFITYAD